MCGDDPRQAQSALACGGARVQKARATMRSGTAMSQAIVLEPIGHVRGGRREPIDDDWDGVEATIELDPRQFKADATASLGDFSHIEVVFHFDRVPDAAINSVAHRPRGARAGSIMNAIKPLYL